jgi:flagellar biosynthetic protein FliR
VGAYQTMLAHVPALLLVVFRIGGLMVFGPVFGSPVIPTRVKVLMTFLIGIAIYPLLAATVLPDAPMELSLWRLAPIVGLELAIGLALGYMASIPLLGMQTGGLMMGQQMGLAFARIYNPAAGADIDVIGQILFFLALAIYLAMGGLEAMLLGVMNSFQHIPLGGFSVDGGLIELLCGMLLASFELALRVAAPVLALVFLQSLALGYMAKTIPQLNILSLGFPMRILVGIGIIIFGLTAISEVMMDGIDVMLGQMHAWIAGFDGG